MISKIVGNYISLTKKGNNYMGLCPFHHDTKPSLFVNDNKKCFSCFVCGISGNDVSFVSRYENCSVNDAMKKVNEILGEQKYNPDKTYLDPILMKTNHDNHIINDLAKMFLFYHQDGSAALTYLKNRKINSEAINKFNLGFCINHKDMFINILSNNGYEYKEKIGISDLQKYGFVNFVDEQFITAFQNRILIPIYDMNNHLVSFTSRSIDDTNEMKYLNSTTFKKNVLYGINKINPNVEKLYICEGIFDCIILNAMGFDAVSTMGVQFTNEQINNLHHFKNLKQVFVCFDNDEAGYQASINLFRAIRLRNKQVIVNFFDYYSLKEKDINELFINDEVFTKKMCFNCIDLNLFKINYYVKTKDPNKLNDLSWIKNDVNINGSIFKKQILERLHENGFAAIANCFSNENILNFFKENSADIGNKLRKKIQYEYGKKLFHNN